MTESPRYLQSVRIDRYGSCQNVDIAVVGFESRPNEIGYIFPPDCASEVECPPRHRLRPNHRGHHYTRDPTRRIISNRSASFRIPHPDRRLKQAGPKQQKPNSVMMTLLTRPARQTAPAGRELEPLLSRKIMGLIRDSISLRRLHPRLEQQGLRRPVFQDQGRLLSRLASNLPHHRPLSRIGRRLPA